MRRFTIAAVAALALTTTPATAQTTISLNGMTGINDNAYSFGPQFQFNRVVASVDLGHIRHELDDPAHQRDRLEFVGLGVDLGPVVVSGHFGQARCAHTLDVYGGSLWWDSFGARILRFEGKTRVQAGFRLSLWRSEGGAATSAAARRAR